MAARKQTVRKVIATESTYIDPLHCDSTISYKVIKRGNRVWGSVQLSDCNRLIEWYFGSDNRVHSVEKVEAAISVLQRFRYQLANAPVQKRKRAIKRVTK